MSTPANFNGEKPTIDPNDAVMLLIDHQSGLFQTVKDIPMPELRNNVGHQMGPIAKPETVTFVTALPKTRSGKIMRRVLKAQALGQDVGDVSTLEA